MSRVLDETHDSARRSWVESANDHPDFPIQNLPFGIFRRREGADVPSGGVAIGEAVLDLAACLDAGLFTGDAERAARACAAPGLNGLMALGSRYWSALRRGVSRLLAVDAAGPLLEPRAGSELLVAASEVELLLPAAIGDYTDFYASVHHATNVGSMLRPENPLLPNYKWVPIGYHGRASSIVPSGAPVHRPRGQTSDGGSGPPAFGPTRRLDYELEVGFFIGPGNPLGEPIAIADAPRHLFGICLVNDWSARDIQAWEYQPLGPFLAKSFATTISPWIVTLDALAPFRAPFERPTGDPDPLPYLRDDDDRRAGAIDLTLEALLVSARMRAERVAPMRLSRSQLAELYWTPAQLVAHHTSGGCNLRPGDLLASGTVSGATRGARGCLLELTWRGAEPIRLPTGEERRFLEDGDEVIFRGWCEREGFARIGLGECRGTVMPA
ncbi:MAG TPA: fumarylacetoacetase [Candidatus Acidoferrum sp.]|nr:fumarylacetoacetase [Candidatus Acidoferrum sp.]